MGTEQGRRSRDREQGALAAHLPPRAHRVRGGGGRVHRDKRRGYCPPTGGDIAMTNEEWDDPKTLDSIIMPDDWEAMAAVIKGNSEKLATIDEHANAYVLPEATDESLGGVIVGAGLTISEGVLSADAQEPYVLPVAAAGTLGGVKIGTGVTITEGVISVETAYLPLSGGTIAGDLTMGGNDIINAVMRDTHEKVNTVASSGSTETLDIETANVHDVTLTDNCTFTFSNPAASGTATSFTLILRQDATGSRAVTWPASVVWNAGVTPVIGDSNGDVDEFAFSTVDGGTTWRGSHVWWSS